MNTIQEDMMNPKLLYCSYFSQGMHMTKGKILHRRTLYDYEFEMIMDSHGGWMWIDDQKVQVEKGDILFRQPGQTTRGIMPYNSIWICFQFVQPEEGIKRDYIHDEHKIMSSCVDHPIIVKIQKKTKCKYQEVYRKLFMDIFNNHIHPHEGSAILIKSLLLQLIYRLSQETTGSNVAKDQHIGINQVLEYIQNHLNQDLSLTQLSKICMLSPTYFHQQFTKIMKITPGQYITNQRIKQVKELLTHTTRTLEDIGLACGYKSSAYFCYVFKREMGMTPTDFRKTYTYIY